jgi:hypothetical protein
LEIVVSFVTTAAAAAKLSPPPIATELKTWGGAKTAQSLLKLFSCVPPDVAVIQELEKAEPAPSSPKHYHTTKGYNFSSITAARIARTQIKGTEFSFQITDLQMNEKVEPIRPASLAEPDYEAETLTPETVIIDCSSRALQKLDEFIDTARTINALYAEKIALIEREAIGKQAQFEFFLGISYLVSAPEWAIEHRFNAICRLFDKYQLFIERFLNLSDTVVRNSDKAALATTYCAALKKTVDFMRAAKEDKCLFLGQLVKRTYLVRNAVNALCADQEKKFEATFNALQKAKPQVPEK